MERLPCTPGCSPQRAVSDGEDYELLMTFSPDVFARLREHDFGVPITAIGRMTASGARGLSHGWQHFTH